VSTVLAVALMLFFATVNGVVAGLTAGFLRGGGKLKYSLLAAAGWTAVCLLYLGVQVRVVSGERVLFLVLASCLLASLTTVLTMAVAVILVRRR